MYASMKPLLPLGVVRLYIVTVTFPNVMCFGHAGLRDGVVFMRVNLQMCCKIATKIAAKFGLKTKNYAKRFVNTLVLKWSQ
jgi:hypothetical protein